MTDEPQQEVRKCPLSGQHSKLRARRAPGWRARPPVPSSPYRFQAVPFTDSPPNRLPVRPPGPPPAACQSPGENTHHHDNSQSGSSLIPSPSQAVRSVMTGAMRLTGLVRETMTHAASATTSVVTRTCCADTMVTESSHQTYSTARQTESYQMAIPTDDDIEAGPQVQQDNSPQQNKRPLAIKSKALPVRKVAPLPQKSEEEPSKAPSTERQDSQPDELGQTYSVKELRRLFSDTYSVPEHKQSKEFSTTYTVPSPDKDLGSTYVVKAENVDEVSAEPERFDLSLKKDRKLCLMAIPAEPLEEEEEAGALPEGAANAAEPPSLTEAMESAIVQAILKEGYSLDFVRHAVWRRLHAGGLASRPELLQAVKDLEQEYTAAEKKLGDKAFLKEKEEITLALAMEEPVVKSVLSLGHDPEMVRHAVWRHLQEGKEHFKSTPELLQGIADLKREYEQADKKLSKTDNSEKTVEEKSLQYEGEEGNNVESVNERAHRSNSVSISEAMASPIVQEVLGAGHSCHLVHHAVWRRLETHGENFLSVAELLQSMVDLEEEYARAKEKLGNDELPNNPPTESTATTATTESDNTDNTDDTPPSPTVESGTPQTPNKESTDNTGNIESELERYREEHTCKVCFDQRIEVVFVPCGHYACCGHCADGMVECPMCRRGVDSTVKVFFS